MYDVTKGNTGNLCKKQREKMVLKKRRQKYRTSDWIFQSLDSLTHGGVRGRELITPSYSIIYRTVFIVPI